MSTEKDKLTKAIEKLKQVSTARDDVQKEVPLAISDDKVIERDAPIPIELPDLKKLDEPDA